MDVLIERARTLFENPPNTGHGARNVSSDQEIREGIRESLDSGKAVAALALETIAGTDLQVLEVGSSWGPVCIGLASDERVSAVIGIEPEEAAVALAQAVLESDCIGEDLVSRVTIQHGAGESLPFPAESFDLIVCHTTIEHVRCVETTIVEMYRVLKPGGSIHLVAPNYIWPFEPHLKLWSFPLGPKWLVKILAKLFRATPGAFVDELQYVHPFWLERIFRRSGITYSNRYLEKLKAILVDRRYDQIVGLTRLAPILGFLAKLHLSGIVYQLARRVHCYPSCDYVLTKPDMGN